MNYRYQEKPVLCDAKECTWWQVDYNRESPNTGICGSAGGVYIDNEGNCKNFTDISIENEQLTESKKLKFKAHFESQFWTSPSRPALHIEWNELGDHTSELLSSLLGHKIIAEVDRYDYYFWSLKIAATPVSKKELEILFSAADADEWDQESHNYDDFPVMEICQELSSKLIVIVKF